MANDLSWHRRFANNSTYRLVRIEPVAEARAQLETECLKDLRMVLTVIKDVLKSLSPTDPNVAFSSAFSATLADLARDPVVVGFKPVVLIVTELALMYVLIPKTCLMSRGMSLPRSLRGRTGEDRMCCA